MAVPDISFRQIGIAILAVSLVVVGIGVMSWVFGLWVFGFGECGLGTGYAYTVTETQTQVTSDTEARSVLVNALKNTNDSTLKATIKINELPNQSTGYTPADLPRDIIKSIRNRADIQSGTDIYPYTFNETIQEAARVDVLVVTETGRVIAVVVGAC